MSSDDIFGPREALAMLEKMEKMKGESLTLFAEGDDVLEPAYAFGNVTKRELFAAMAMQAGIISCSQIFGKELATLDSEKLRKIISEGAVKDAAALIEELGKENPEPCSGGC